MILQGLNNNFQIVSLQNNRIFEAEKFEDILRHTGETYNFSHFMNTWEKGSSIKKLGLIRCDFNLKVKVVYIVPFLASHLVFVLSIHTWVIFE